MKYRFSKYWRRIIFKSIELIRVEALLYVLVVNWKYLYFLFILFNHTTFIFGKSSIKKSSNVLWHWIASLFKKCYKTKKKKEMIRAIEKHFNYWACKVIRLFFVHTNLPYDDEVMYEQLNTTDEIHVIANFTVLK